MVAAGGESSNVHCIECVLQTHVSNGVNMYLFPLALLGLQP